MSHSWLDRLEATALAASILVAVLTYVMVGHFVATELNPLVGPIVDVAGWYGFGAAKLVAVVLAFALLRRAAGWPDQDVSVAGRSFSWSWSHFSLVAGSWATLLTVLNAAHDVFIILEAGLPETIVVQDVATFTVVLLVATVAYLARETWVPTARSLIGSFDRSHLASRRVVAIVAVTTLVILASGGIQSLDVGGAVQTVSAATTAIDSFEDGDISEWSGTGTSYLSATKNAALKDTYGMHYDGSTSDNAYRTFTQKSYDKLTFRQRFDNIENDYNIYWFWKTNSGGNAIQTRMQSGEFYNYDGSTWTNYGSMGLSATNIYLFEWDFDYANNDYNITVTEKSTGNVVFSKDNLPMESAVSGLGRIEMNLYAGNAFDFDQLATDGNFGQPVSGTITDESGNELSSATVNLTQSGSVVKSTTTNSTGGYSFSGVKDGDYTVKASADGYVSNSTTINVSGAAVRDVNLTLGGNLQGTVNKKAGGACAGCTVEIWMMDDANTTVGSGETLQEAQTETLNNLSRAVPRDAFDKSFNPISNGSFTGAQATKQVLVHSKKAWYKEGEVLGINYPVGSAGTHELRSPLLQVEPNTEYAFSIWERGRDPVLEDGVDSKIEPGISTEGTVVVEQIGPGNSTVSRIKRSTEPKIKTGTIATVKKHEYVALSLPEGYFRVRAANSSKSYIIRSGQPESIPRTLQKGLEGVNNTTTNIAQRIQDKINSGALNRATVTTGPNGHFSYAVPSGFSTVAVTVFDGKGLTKGIVEPTLQDVRNEIRRQNYNGSIYLSTSPEIVHPPDQNVQITVTEISRPTLGDLGNYLDQLAWVENLVNNEAFHKLQSLFTSVAGSTQELLDRRDELAETILGNSDLRQTFRELAQERGVPSDLSDDSLSDSQLRSQINLMTEVVTKQQPGANSSPTSRNPAAGGVPTLDAVPNQDGSTTINVEVPIAGQLNESDNAQVVLLRCANGSTRIIDDNKTSVNSGVSTDTIEVVNVTTACAGGQVDVVAPGENEGRARESLPFDNPAISGRVPKIASWNVNSMRPGPDEQVVVGVTPGESSSFKTLVGSTVWAPNGSVIPSNVKNGKIHFSTAGAGSHVVQANVTDGSRYYAPTVRLAAGNQSVNYPSALRVHNGVLGRSVIVSKKIKSGSVTVENGGSVARITAKVAKDAPNEIVVHARDLTGRQQTIEISVVQASDGSRIETSPRIQLHMARLSEEALVRANSHPVTTESNQYGVVEHQSEQTVVTTYVTEGEVEVSANNNPSLTDEVTFWLERQVQKAPLPLQVGPSPVLDVLADAATVAPLDMAAGLEGVIA